MPEPERPVPDPAADEPGAADQTTDDQPTDDRAADDAAPAEPEWWEDPRMPWKGKPGRRDIACWAAFSLTGVYALVLLPLRPVLLGANPYLLAALGGSRVSAVTIGALASTGVGFWPLGLLLGTLGTVKFDPIYWWAGRLWGRGMLEMASGRSPRAARNAARAERLAQRYGALAIALGYVVPLIPGPIVYATVGAAGMSLRRFLLVDLAAAAATRGLYIWLGWSIGAPAVHVVEVIAQYSWYLSLVLLAGVLVTTIRQSRKRSAAV